MSELERILSNFDERLSKVENFLWGPEPGKVGNQPLFSLPGLINPGSYTGGFPIYFDGYLFEFGGMLLTPPVSPLLVLCRVTDPESVTSTIARLVFEVGEKTSSLVLPENDRVKVAKRSWGTILVDSSFYGGGTAKDLTVSWRAM